jgi:hypothetical protein
MRTTTIALFLAVLAAGWNRTAMTPTTGPYGGDVVPIKDGSGYAELVADPDTGEAMVHTWDRDLKTRRPVEKEPITVGSGEKSTELTPHPMDTDPTGTCSRFYGHAEWMRGGNIEHGWMMMWSEGNQKHSFDWRNCWQGGRMHGTMWKEMGKHRRMMGPGHGGPMMGPGHGPGRPGEKEERQ